MGSIVAACQAQKKQLTDNPHFEVVFHFSFMSNSPKVTVYGIPNCGSVKKGREWLTEHGVDYVFHDFKKQGISAQEVNHWLKSQSWEILVNRKGTTWRQLDDSLKATVVDAPSARALMLSHPSVIKRPVVVKDNLVIVGVNPDAWNNVK
jgi:arsenate reductase (glutaredoxin)